MSALADVPLLSKSSDERLGSPRERSRASCLSGLQRIFSRRTAFPVLVATLLLLYCFRANFRLSSGIHAHLLSAASHTASAAYTTTPHAPSSTPPEVRFTNGSLLTAPASGPPTDWSQFAYTQYATSINYLCNSVMLFATLHSLGSLADRVLLYPAEFHPTHSVIYDSPEDEAAANVVEVLLGIAQDRYNVILKPVHTLQHENSNPDADATWSESYTKLLAFNQTEYKRVLNLDSDSTVLQNMDELFLLPSAPVAMPRAYWGALRPDGPRQLSSQLMLIEPSPEEFARVEAAIESATDDMYDMEIMNNLYKDSCLVIPHRPYDLLSGEFRAASDQHRRYIGNASEAWNANRTLAEAKFLHFSDWPVPKPWFEMSPKMEKQYLPKCVQMSKTPRATGQEKPGGGERDCTDRDAWKHVYVDFRKRRLDVCGLGTIPIIDEG